jgi:hypothetical protein
MKKYKLIKEYPDSLKKGTIVSKDQLGNYITEKPLFIIESIVVENYPEFWEEVIELVTEVKRNRDGVTFKIGEKVKSVDDILTIKYFTHDGTFVHFKEVDEHDATDNLVKIEEEGFTIKKMIELDKKHVPHLMKEEPNYIITAFRSIIFPDAIWSITKNDAYMRDGCTEWSLKSMIVDEAMEIYSVKNKNGEEFTIGEEVGVKINQPYSIQTIKSFKIINDTMTVETDKGMGSINLLRKFTKTPDIITSFNLGEPLFTTVDGLKIYRGQDVTLYIIDGEGYKTVDVENFNEEDAKVAERYKCFANKMFLAEQIEQNKIKPILITNDGKRIYEESEKIYAVLAKANWAQEKIPACNATYRNEDWKYFSTSEARINYIKQNKPTISIADIEKAYTWDKSAPLYIDFINNLKRIVSE